MSIATMVVDFSTGETLTESGVSLILDPEGNKDSEGNDKTQFAPGESVAMLAILPDNLILVSVACTQGTVMSGGTVTRTETTQMLFAVVDEPQGLIYTPVGSASALWYGRQGSISTDLDNNSVSAISGVPCIGDISYPFQGISVTLVSPSNMSIPEGESIPIGVVVYVEST